MRPLRAEDFPALHEAASDPLIWEQHPNRNRWRREEFEIYFRGGLESGGALLIQERGTGAVIGSSRYYDYNPEAGSVAIGYTFFIRRCWRQGHNRAVKRLMLDHAFAAVPQVLFHVGECNLRSREAVLKLGAVPIDRREITYAGEARSNWNFVYRLTAAEWQSRREGGRVSATPSLSSPDAGKPSPNAGDYPSTAPGDRPKTGPST